jgi:hypothetical protein
MDLVEHFAEHKIHLHFVGQYVQSWFSEWRARAPDPSYVHLHPPVEPPEWTLALSQFDAGWLHVFRSHNQGDVRRLDWPDLNFPARIGTYAAAGLPLLIAANPGCIVSAERMVRQHEVGIVFEDVADLARQLRPGEHVGRPTDNMKRQRHLFAFDHHVDRLVAFFREVIAASPVAR